MENLKLNGTASDKKYRNCVASGPGKTDCEYLVYNEYNVPCCGIDSIVGVEWYGCRPVDIKVRD